MQEGVKDVPLAMAASPVPVPRAQRRGRFRYLVLSSLWLTGAFLYFDRINMSLAVPHIKEELGLTGVEVGFILSTFFWGYIAGQFAGGFAADRMKIRLWTIAFFVLWCVTTAATGLCRSVAQFAMVRTLFGLSEGAVINPVTKLTNHWVFPTERGRANGLQVGFGYLGLVIGTPIVALLIEAIGWRAMFFASGALTLLGVAVFALLAYDHPRDHPWMPKAQRDELEGALALDRVTFDPATGTTRRLTFREGLRALSGNRAYWCICASYFVISGVYFTNFSWLPGYLTMERGLTAMGSGLTLVIPYAAAALGALGGGLVADRIGSRCVVILAAVALTIPAILGMLWLEGEVALVGTLSLMLFCNAAAVSLVIVLLFDLLPAEVMGTALAILTGAFGGMGGLVGPLLMGYSLDLTGSFAGGFVALALGLAASALLFGFVWRYERQVRAAKRRNAALAPAHGGPATR